MKKYFSTLIIIFTITFVSAQNSERAKEILDQVSAKTKAYMSITAGFDFTMINTDADIKETNSGTIIIQNDSYKLSLNSVEIFNNGVDQWTYMIDAMEVNISAADGEDEGTINPATIFTIYEKGYTFNYIDEINSNGAMHYEIELIPIEEKEFSKVKLFIDTANLTIQTAQMMGVDGNNYVISITSFDTEKEYQSEIFVFDTVKNPDVDIIDMR